MNNGFDFAQVPVRGRPIFVRSLPNAARYVKVFTTRCENCASCAISTNYPNGLICAADDGNKELAIGSEQDSDPTFAERDSCQGDSGGPLIGEYSARTRLGKRYALIGIITQASCPQRCTL